MEQTITTKQRKKLTVGATVEPEIQQQVAQLAEQREWSMAQTSGHLIKLGLEKLKEIAEQQSSTLTLNA